MDIFLRKGYNISEIIDYADVKNLSRRYDEVITEYRVKLLLEGFS